MCNIDWPAWIQAITATAALILAIVVASQKTSIRGMGKAIDELRKHTLSLESQANELKAQAETLVKRYGLELELSKEKRFPIFEKASELSEDPNFRMSFSLKNIGKKAFDLNFESCSNEFSVDVVPSSYTSRDRSVDSNNNVRILIKFNSEDSFNKRKFNFQLTCKNNYGHICLQRIIKKAEDNDIVIVFPEDLNYYKDFD